MFDSKPLLTTVGFLGRHLGWSGSRMWIGVVCKVIALIRKRTYCGAYIFTTTSLIIGLTRAVKYGLRYVICGLPRARLSL